jgi:hypothetical protein
VDEVVDCQTHGRKPSTRWHVRDTLASEIYSRAHMGHVSARAGWMETRLVANGSGEAEEHGGVACLRVELPKVDRSEFEKPKSKDFKKMMDPRIRTAGQGGIRTIVDGRANKIDIQRYYLKRGRYSLQSGGYGLREVGRSLKRG